MIEKSKDPLYCRCCGKGIKKYTTTVEVRETAKEFETNTSWRRYVYLGEGIKLSTKADCENYTHHKVVSVKYWNGYVLSFSIWDGETYVDPYFCSGQCARLLGYSAARKGWCTDNYAKRFRKQDVA